MAYSFVETALNIGAKTEGFAQNVQPKELGSLVAMPVAVSHERSIDQTDDIPGISMRFQQY